MGGGGTGPLSLVLGGELPLSTGHRRENARRHAAQALLLFLLHSARLQASSGPRSPLPLPEPRPGAALGSEGCGPPLPAGGPVVLAQGGAFTQTMWPGHLLLGPNSTSWVSDSFVTVFPAMTLRPQHASHRATKAQADPRPSPQHRPVPRCLIPVAHCTDHKATGHCHARRTHATVLPPVGALVGVSPSHLLSPRGRWLVLNLC